MRLGQGLRQPAADRLLVLGVQEGEEKQTATPSTSSRRSSAMAASTLSRSSGTSSCPRSRVAPRWCGCGGGGSTAVAGALRESSGRSRIPRRMLRTSRKPSVVSSAARAPRGSTGRWSPRYCRARCAPSVPAARPGSGRGASGLGQTSQHRADQVLRVGRSLAQAQLGAVADDDVDERPPGVDANGEGGLFQCLLQLGQRSGRRAEDSLVDAGHFLA